MDAPTTRPALPTSIPPGATCLVVDDEPRIRQVLARLMKADGFECREAGSGTEALVALDDAPADLVISDLRMPQMDGVELLRHLRERHPDTAVMLITAVADVDVAVGCLATGAMDYLTKPFHLDEVRARVAQAMQKRRLIIENRSYQLRLEQRVTVQATRMEELFLAGIQSLAEALEVKDRYTRGHSVRVSQYSVAIVRALGLDDNVARQVELGGHVHDIGKIGVREAILNKPGPLTDEEYDHIMLHPVVGWRILSPLLQDAPMALNIVRSHHERVDGRGIPDGLQGSDIPLEARIAGIADSFDAMTSWRPYRTAMSLSDTLAELTRNRGTQFDPVALDAFLSVIDAGGIELPKLPGEERTLSPPIGAPVTPERS